MTNKQKKRPGAAIILGAKAATVTPGDVASAYRNSTPAARALLAASDADPLAAAVASFLANNVGRDS